MGPFFFEIYNKNAPLKPAQNPNPEFSWSSYRNSRHLRRILRTLGFPESFHGLAWSGLGEVAGEVPGKDAGQGSLKGFQQRAPLKAIELPSMAINCHEWPLNNHLIAFNGYSVAIK